MRRFLVVPAAFLAVSCAAAPEPAADPAAPVRSIAMVVINEKDVERVEPTPHGAIGTSTAYRMSDRAPGRMMEFRKRILHKGSAIGLHVLKHDEVYYVLSGVGEVRSDGDSATLTTGMAAYLYKGANVGIWQTGEAPLEIIVSYPLEQPAQ